MPFRLRSFLSLYMKFRQLELTTAFHTTNLLHNAECSLPTHMVVHGFLIVASPPNPLWSKPQMK